MIVQRRAPEECHSAHELLLVKNRVLLEVQRGEVFGENILAKVRIVQHGLQLHINQH